MTIMESLLDLEHSGFMQEELGKYTSSKYLSYKKVIYELAKIVDKSYNNIKMSETASKLNMFNTDLLISVPIDVSNSLFDLGISELIIRFYAKELELNTNLEHSSLYRFLIGEGIVNYKLDTIYTSNSIFKFVDSDFGILIDSNIIINKCQKDDKLYIYNKSRLKYSLDCSNIQLSTMLDYHSLQTYELFNIKKLEFDLKMVTSFDIDELYMKINEYIMDENNCFSDGCEFSFILLSKKQKSLYDLKELLENRMDMEIKYNHHTILIGKVYIIK